MTIRNDSETTAVPNDFIDKYFAEASHVQSLLYILLLRNVEISVAEAAKTLDVTQKSAESACDYWVQKGLLTRSGDNIKVMDASGEKQGRAVQKIVDIEARPVYTPAEIDRFMREDDIRLLFKSSETILGKTLTYNDLNLLLSFYEWNRLPVDVIITMLSYCAENGHYGMRYIEKVALNWDDEGIDTVEKANDYIKLFNTEYRKILRAFGVSHRAPAKTELKYMRKWIKEWEIPIEVILEACDRTVLNTGAVKFSYADKVLKEWNAQSVKGMKDIEEADKRHNEKKKSAPAVSTKPKSRNRFINYTQREWDFDAIEMLEREKIKKDLGVQ